MIFKKGDLLVEFDGKRTNDNIWTFNNYTNDGQVVLKEFLKQGYGFHPDIFRLATPEEVEIYRSPLYKVMSEEEDD